MKNKLLLVFFAFLLFSCQSEKIGRTLITDFNFDIPLVNEADDLLGMKARMIPLDTLTEALVGRIGKIIRHDNHFYILSDDRRILHFDDNGKFLSSLDKWGGGPDEYTWVLDFNLFTGNGHTEIWICDSKRIRKYSLSGNAWEFIGTIDFEFVIHKCKIISDEYMLLVAGQNEESLMLTDIAGKQLGHFLKKEIPFLVFRAVQFIHFDSCFIFQLGFANEGVALNTNDFSFERIKIVEKEQFLSSKNLMDMFDKYGQDYLGQLSTTTYVRGLININDHILLHYRHHDGHYVAVRMNGVWRRMKVDRNKTFSSISTFCGSESINSFIRYEYPEDDNLNLLLYEYVLF